MKHIILIFSLFFITCSLHAQRITEGESQINGGIGFSSNGWGLPFYAGYDYGIHEDITVGAQITYSSKKENFGFGNEKVKGTWFGIGVNGNYHLNTVLNIPNEWDVYGGLTLAYNSFSWNYPSNYPNNFKTGKGSDIGVAAQIGARYFFNDNMAVNLELGGGNIASGGKIGITYRLQFYKKVKAI